MIYKVKLNGKDVLHVQSISVDFESPMSDKGINREPTSAATITITRDASNDATTWLFKLATISDVKKKIIGNSTLEFRSDDGKDAYSFDLKKAYVSDWSIHNPKEAQADTLEVITLRVGEMDYCAAGQKEPFAVQKFKDLAK